MSQYRVIVNRQQQGPIEEAALVEGFRNGIYPAGTLVWCAGMPDWKPIETVIPAPVAPEVPEIPEAPPVPPAPAAPGAPSAFEAKMKEFMEKASVFAKDLPAKAKKFTVKQWSIVGGAAVAVLVLIVGLICLMPKSFNSDQDVKEYLDGKVDVIKKVDSKLGTEYKKSLPDLKKALKDDASTGSQRRLATALAGFGEKGAMVYLFEEKDFPAAAADSAFGAAAQCGHVHIMKYLKDKHCSGDEDVFESAFRNACTAGMLDSCEYLVDKCEVSVEDKHLLPLLSLSKDDYKRIAKILSVHRGSKIEADDVMENVADVAKFLLKNGASIDKDDEAVAKRIKECPNAALKKVISK